MQLEPITLDTNDADVSLTVLPRINSRAKRLILRYDARKSAFTLTLPRKRDLKSAHGFLNAHISWMIDQCQKSPAKVRFTDGGMIPFFGDEYTIQNNTSRLRGVVEVHENTLIVPGHAEHVHRKIVQFLKTSLREKISILAREKAARIDRRIKRIRISDPKTRWGSCSSSGTLSFSARLALTPIYVVDYLAAHEVAHMIHMDHSKDFWTLCESLCSDPTDMNRARKWLKANGNDIQGYALS